VILFINVIRQVPYFIWSEVKIDGIVKVCLSLVSCADHFRGS